MLINGLGTATFLLADKAFLFSQGTKKTLAAIHKAVEKSAVADQEGAASHQHQQGGICQPIDPGQVKGTAWQYERIKQRSNWRDQKEKYPPCSCMEWLHET